MKAKERHEIKTDKFLDIMVGVETFIIRHARTIGFAIISIVVILIAWFATTSYIDNREDSASTALNLILGDINHFQSVESNGDSQAEEIVSKLKSILTDHGGTAASVAAKYYLASVYLKTDQQGEAETLLREVIDSRHPTIWQSAASDLGAILQTQEKFEEAASVYANVVKSGSSNVPLAFFAWRAGQCYEKLGDNAQALSMYNDAKQSQELPLDSLLARKIETRIQMLSETE